MQNENIIRQQAELYDSFYFYDEKTILENIRRLKGYFPEIQFLYSMKCNPHTQVLDTIFGQGFGADAASLGETLMAYEKDLTKDRVYYSAPGKTFEDIQASIDKAYLIADSIAELYRIQEVAASKGIICQVGIRINPEYSFDDEEGHFNKFGVDQDQAFAFLKANPCSNIKVNGLHIHLKSQELRTDVLARHFTKIFQLAEQFAEWIDSLDYINLGSGIGVTYGPDDEPVDLERLSAVVNGAIDNFKEKYPDTKIMMETGRYVVCKSGIYVTKVVDRKVSHGKTILLLKNTLNGFFKPAMAKVIESYVDEEKPAAAEPIYTCKDAVELIPLLKDYVEGDALEQVTLWGNLCTGMDKIVDDVWLPHMEYGDLFVMTNAGSYAAVLSPMQFSSQTKPEELFLTAEGVVIG